MESEDAESLSGGALDFGGGIGESLFEGRDGGRGFGTDLSEGFSDGTSDLGVRIVELEEEGGDSRRGGGADKAEAFGSGFADTGVFIGEGVLEGSDRPLGLGAELSEGDSGEEAGAAVVFVLKGFDQGFDGEGAEAGEGADGFFTDAIIGVFGSAGHQGDEVGAFGVCEETDGKPAYPPPGVGGDLSFQDGGAVEFVDGLDGTFADAMIGVLEGEIEGG